MSTMRLLFCLIFWLLVLSGSAFAFGQEGCGAGSCRDCHSLDVKEAEGLFKGSVEKVLRVEFAEMPGVWLVEVENKGERFPLYVDFSKQYVVAGNIYRLPEQDVKKTKPVEQVDVSKIPQEDALLLGNPMAETRVIVFTDPLCPYCEQLHAELEQVIAKDPNIAFLIKLNPLDMHGQEAYDLARAIVCGKSLATLEESFNLIGDHGRLLQLKKQPDADPKQLAKLQAAFDAKIRKLTANSCETPVVAATKALAGELGLNGTPTLVLPDGTVLPGARKAEDLLQIIHSKPTSLANGKKS
jgi:thiol:disulfide interchange protein DsbC